MQDSAHCKVNIKNIRFVRITGLPARWSCLAARLDKVRSVGLLDVMITRPRESEIDLSTLAPRLVALPARLQIAVETVFTHRLHDEVDLSWIDLDDLLEIGNAFEPPLFIITLRQVFQAYEHVDEADISFLIDEPGCDFAQFRFQITTIQSHFIHSLYESMI